MIIVHILLLVNQVVIFFLTSFQCAIWWCIYILFAWRYGPYTVSLSTVIFSVIILCFEKALKMAII